MAVFAGLLANTLFGVWWLDGLVALVIAGWAVIEGRRVLGRAELCVHVPARSPVLNFASRMQPSHLQISPKTRASRAG
jgi:hypothetical protein